jgi:ABC-2 type transport system permease protein
MRPDLRKIWVVASTEFGSFVRTKAFIIGILLLPVITGGSIFLQLILAQRVDTKTRTLAVIDRTGELYPALERAADTYNSQTIDVASKKAVRPRIQASRITTASQGEVDSRVVLELSDRVRRGELDAFAVIPPHAIETPPTNVAQAPSLEYHSDNPNDDLVRNWLVAAVNGEIRVRRFRAAAIDQAVADRVSQPVGIDNLGLFDRDLSAPAGQLAIKAAQKVDPIRTFVVPAILMFTVLLVIMTTAPQLLNSVIEEKMSKISEVLLGSITPFELMLGKLLGNAGVVMVLASLYIGAGYGVAAYYGYADMISAGLLIGLGLYLLLAILFFGSLYMAVGAACNELKDAQSLMMPVMLLGMFPCFVWMAVLRNPSSSLSVGLSLFPPATPFLMLMRLALRPAPPAWQVGLSFVLTLLTALFCVWAASKIFRTGLLMQGKTPSYRELARWVMAR